MAAHRWLALAVGGACSLLPPPAMGANSAHERLAAMSEVDRSDALALLVESSGQPCRTVARTLFQGHDTSGHALWNVECGGGEAYLVLIMNDGRGSTRVLSCRRLAAVGGGRCFQQLD